MIDPLNITPGQLIAHIRESHGWSRRKLASKYGTSTRRIKAIELDRDPTPKLEQPQHKMVYIPFLGYSVRVFTRRPVADRNFDLQQQQTRVLKWLGDYFSA